VSFVKTAAKAAAVFGVALALVRTCSDWSGTFLLSKAAYNASMQGIFAMRYVALYLRRTHAKQWHACIVRDH